MKSQSTQFRSSSKRNCSTKQASAKRGFTVVEVVIAISIGGLIFAVVLAGVPRLQASRRDSQRRSDMQELIAAVERYENNTNQSLTHDEFDDSISGTSTFTEYIPSDFIDPSTKAAYALISSKTDQDQPGEITFWENSVCGSDRQYDLSVVNYAVSQYSLSVKLEKGYYCLDNTSN